MSSKIPSSSIDSAKKFLNIQGKQIFFPPVEVVFEGLQKVSSLYEKVYF